MQTMGTRAAAASSTLSRVPDPARSGIAVANDRASHGATSSTRPVTSMSAAASAWTCAGGLRPMSARRSPGAAVRTRGQMSRARTMAASTLGRQS